MLYHAKISDDFYLGLYERALHSMSLAQCSNLDPQRAIEKVLEKRSPLGLCSDDIAVLLLALQHPRGEAAQMIMFAARAQ
jgi:hypothetical protein